MTAKKQTKPNPITMHPREPLTKKARGAIREYAIIKCRDLLLLDFAVKYTLEAERMPRQRLYAILEGKGYRWDTARWKKIANGVRDDRQNPGKAA